jgi:pimeloyl-ACP methyl ester carboxylesterase
MAAIHRLLKKPFFGRFQKPWRWPEGVSADGWERVRFQSKSGAALAAVFGAATLSSALAAGQYLRTRFPVLPLAAIGASFGAGYTICAMARDAGLFRSAILEAAFPTLPYYWRRYPVPYAALRLSQFVYPSLERSLRPIEAAARLKGRPRVLLIFGGKDEVSPPSIAAEFERTLRDSTEVELWLVPGADHIQAYSTAREEYRRRVLACLEKLDNTWRMS